MQRRTGKCCIMTTEDRLSDAKKKILSYIGAHSGTYTSNIVLSLNSEFDVVTVVTALTELESEGKIYAKSITE